MRRKIYLALCISILFLFSSCNKQKQANATSDLSNLNNIQIEYETGEVKRENMMEHIVLRDVLMFPGNNWNITFPDDVVIKNVYAEFRVPIEKGKLILELDTTEIDEKIQYKEFDIEMEKAYYDEMKKNGSSEIELKIKEIDIKILNEEVAQLKKQREGYKIYAPERCYIAKGSVVKDRRVKAGESLLALSDLSKYEIKTTDYVEMKKYENVAIGEKVILDDGNETYEGEVIFMTFNERGLGHLYFAISKDALDNRMVSYGFPLAITFPDLEVKDVLTVPQAAIKYNHKYYVEVIKDGIRRMRFVKFGAIGLDMENKRVVQVLSGVSEGETVVIKVKKDSK